MNVSENTSGGKSTRFPINKIGSLCYNGVDLKPVPFLYEEHT
jgi:hypothetical protein